MQRNRKASADRGSTEMLTREVIGVIDDDPTPKIGGGRTAYTINSRDHKGMMIVVLGESDDISESDRQPNGE